MAERFRIEVRDGADIYLDDSNDSLTGEARVTLTVDSHSHPTNETVWLDTEHAIAIRDALDAFIAGRFDDFLRRTTNPDENG